MFIQIYIFKYLRYNTDSDHSGCYHLFKHENCEFNNINIMIMYREG